MNYYSLKKNLFFPIQKENLGTYEANLFKLWDHDLELAFIQTSIDTKIPSIPYGSMADSCGYNFKNEEAKKASYFYVRQ